MIIRDIVEREAGPSAPPRPPSLPSNNGFPAPRRRDRNPQQGSSRQSGNSTSIEATRQQFNGMQVAATRPQQAEAGPSKLNEAEMIRREVDAENAARVASMSAEEIAEEVEELTERFGGSIVELMRKRREARERPGAVSIGKQREEVESVYRDVEKENLERVARMTDAERQQELDESRDRFGDKVIDGLRRRAEARRDAPQVPIETSKGVEPGSSSVKEAVPPDDMKEKYFPNVPLESDKLAWMQPITTSTTPSTPRFDLTGKLLSHNEQQDLPSDVGLHHHGDAPDLAGYTLEEIIHLSKSTMISQRVAMMDVFARVINRYASDETTNIITKDILEQGLQLALGILSGHNSVNLLRAAIELLSATLGFSTWDYLDDSVHQFHYDPESIFPSITSLPFQELIPQLDTLISTPDYLPPRSVQLLIRILHRAATFSVDLAEEVCRLIPHLVKAQITTSWPAGGRPPSMEALNLLLEVISASRRCADALLPSGIFDSLLRFLVPSTWTEPESQIIAASVIRIYHALARYGLASSTAVSSYTIWSDLAQAITAETPNYLVEAYFDLLASWIICATDPHKTTPEHDLTWSQISPMGWADHALETAKASIASEALSTLRAALGVLQPWLLGITLNDPIKLQDEKHRIRRELAIAGLGDLIIPRNLQQDGFTELQTQVAIAAIRIHNLCPMPTDAGLLLGRTPFFARISVACFRQDSNSIAKVERYPELGYELIQASKLQNKIVPRFWSKPSTIVRNALRTITKLQPGQESMALDILDDILKADWYVLQPEFTESLKLLGNGETSLQLLRPLLQYPILPTLENIVGPITPSPQFLKVTTTLFRPAEIGIGPGRGLPLSPDWIFSPLDELLRSADSPALAQGPQDWNPSEIEIVQATLLLARLSIKMIPGIIPKSGIILGLMKVYMLEHATSTKGLSGGEVEVFRDTLVSECMEELLSSLGDIPLQNHYEDPVNPEEENISKVIQEQEDTDTLETLSKSFLGDIPFYQFYSDFVALFEGISFGSPTFARLVLPPLAMNYSSDYRRVLWVQHPTALRLIRLGKSHVPLESDLGGFFEPAEEDEEILIAYAAALARRWLPKGSFLYCVALHYLARYLWGNSDSRARKTALGQVLSGSDEVFKEVIEYDHTDYQVGGTVPQEEKDKRVTMIRAMLGPRATARVQQL